MLSPRKLYSFFIDDVHAAGLKAIKHEIGISESEQIRRALDDWLKKYERAGTKTRTGRKRSR